MLIAKIIENNTMRNIQELHLFLCSFLPAIFTSSNVSAHSSTNLSANLSYAYNFYNLNITYKYNITWFITFTLTITRIPNISSITYTFINQFFTFTPTFIIIPMLFILQTIASSLHLHLYASYHFMCLVSLVLDWIL